MHDRNLNRKLVIIDDEEGILYELSEFFRDEGFEVHSASDGTGGLALINKIKPDICLLDMKLPDISGLKVLKMIKESFPQIKVVVNTGYVDQALIDHATELKCDIFLHKPFDLLELRQKIDDLFA